MAPAHGASALPPDGPAGPAGDPAESPADSHVHSEWSWDASAGSMDRTCARAVALGLPSVAFTEHLDLTPWTLPADTDVPRASADPVSGGVFMPPLLDVDGYLESIERCRAAYPTLRIYTGVELGEPHWHATRVPRLLAGGRFERTLASVHSARRLPPAGGHSPAMEAVEVGAAYATRPRSEVVVEYLREVVRLVDGFDDFQVLAHIDYPVRYWPVTAPPFDPAEFEDELRYALAALATAGKVLELNTRVPLHPLVLTWWREQGGQAITFGSDAHEPAALASGFREAVAVASAAGFRAGDDPLGFWRRD